MKLIVALAAAGLVSWLTAITPANAQKDPACMEKCNRENKIAGGAMQRLLRFGKQSTPSSHPWSVDRPARPLCGRSRRHDLPFQADRKRRRSPYSRL